LPDKSATSANRKSAIKSSESGADADFPIFPHLMHPLCPMAELGKGAGRIDEGQANP